MGHRHMAVCTRSNLLKCMDKMMSRREIARTLGVSEDYLRRAMKREGLDYSPKQKQEIKRRVMAEIYARSADEQRAAANVKIPSLGLFAADNAANDRIAEGSEELARRCNALLCKIYAQRRAA